MPVSGVLDKFIKAREPFSVNMLSLSRSNKLKFIKYIMHDITSTITSLPLWHGNIAIEPLNGGLTNANYLVTDNNGKFVVRMGEDIVEHHVMRFNELAASRAAHAAGLSPEVLHHEPGILVLQYIHSATLTQQDVRKVANLDAIIELIKKCHNDIPKYLRGPSLVFSVFQIIRDYSHTLREKNSSHLPLLPQLQKKAELLETTQGSTQQVFGHNDLLAANLLDDGNRLWLIDWDYAGFNSPLFDLANLASNNEFSPSLEKHLLESYFDCTLGDELLYKFQAMKCASLLRETMWSMVSQVASKIDHDFAEYTRENLARFDKAYCEFVKMGK